MTLTFTLFPAGRGFLTCADDNEVDEAQWNDMCEAWRRWAWSAEGIQFLTQDLEDTFRKAEFRLVEGDLITI